MESECSVCLRVSKYKCIRCNIAICNVCSTAASCNTEGYCEDEKKLGYCKNCTPSENEVVIVEPPKKIQKTLFSMKKVPSTPSAGSSLKIQPAKKPVRSPDIQSKASKAKERTVTPATVNKWKSELVEKGVSEWLTFDTDKDGKARNLKCKVCIMYEHEIKKMPFYSNSFVVGCTNYKKSAIEDHATKSQPHRRAYELYLKSKGVAMDERAHKLSLSNTNIITGIIKMDKNDEDRTKRKFEVAYWIAKTNSPMTLYNQTLKLEKHHGVDIGSAYNSDRACGVFIDYIGKDLQQKLCKDITNAKFISVLCDGSTDSAVIENEVVYALHFNPLPPGSDEVEVKTSLLKVNYLKHQHAEGVSSAVQRSYEDIINSIESEFEDIGVTSFKKKLIGFTSDGASVNRGEKNSVKMILREMSPWLVFIWCLAHRLELALADAFRDTEFQTIDNMLLRIFYMYQKGPKKLRELRELHDIYKQAMVFDVAGIKPPKSSGTRWISHKYRAMKMCLDKWGIYMRHLERLSEDKNSLKSQDRAKLKGYLIAWKKPSILLLLALFVDLLEIPSILSLSFQDEKADTVEAMRCLNKTKDRLDLFDKKSFEKLPHVKNLTRKITSVEGIKKYQDIPLPNFDNEFERIKKKKDTFSQKMRNCIQSRLEEESDSEFLFTHVVHILNTEAWIRETTNEDGVVIRDTEFADDAISYVYNHFKDALGHANVNCDFPDLLQQWHDLLEYSIEFLSLSTTHYRKIWRRIFSAPRSKAWLDVLTLVELLFTIPVTNAKLERMFSKLKHIKTNCRSRLTEIRLDSLLRIAEDGPKFGDYDVSSAMSIWAKDKFRRPNQPERSGYKKRKSNKPKIASLSDSDSLNSEDDDENESLFEETLD